MNIASKRAEQISLTGLILCAIFFIATRLIAGYNLVFAVDALSWQILAGMVLWFVLLIVFHQRSLAERERLDTAEVIRARQEGAIFETDTEHAEMFNIAQRRLAALEKWFVPIMGLLIAAYELGIALFLIKGLTGPLDLNPRNQLVVSAFMVVIAFVSFIIGRYATGMGAGAELRMLRAGGSYFVATAILSLMIAISMWFYQFKTEWLFRVLNWVIPVLLAVLGGEIVLNSVLDIYRPRIPGQYGRPAIDSRMLGLINEPGGILHTVSSAIDYQFGFKVSQTWFYKLFEKAVLPLVLFCVVLLYLLSCIVIVGPGEEAVIEHLGSFSRTAGSGVTFKLPDPFDKVYKYSVSQVRQINIGYVVGEDDNSKKPFLWGEKHYKEEDELLVATPDIGFVSEGGVDTRVPVVNIVMANLPVQYRIRSIKDFVYNNHDSQKMLEAIAHREVVQFAASARIESSTDGVASASGDGLGGSLLGMGRQAASEYLMSQIQKRADEAGLGVEIVLVGLQGVHPPPEVAADYQKVIAAVQQKQTLILLADAGKNKILSELTGSVETADALYALANQYQQAVEQKDQRRIREIEEQLQKQFMSAGGEIFKILAEAQGYAFDKAVLAEATGQRFKSQVAAYRTSPQIYKRLMMLQMLEETLSNVRKYVVVAQDKDQQVYIIDLTEKISPDVLEMNWQDILKKK